MRPAPAVFRCALRSAFLVFATAFAAAQEAGYSRSIIPGAPGPNRLGVDAELLAGAASVTRPALAGLSHLRIHDASGREVSYLLIPPATPPPSWQPGTLLAVARTKTTSGFELDLGKALPVDGVRLTGLPTPFMKRARLEGSGDRQRWTLLVEQGTLFDLPQERLTLRELRFTAGAYRYLRLTWDDRSSGILPIPLAAEARLAEAGSQPPPVQASVEFTRRPSEPGRSRFRLRLPAAGLPVTAMTLTCGGGYVLRQAMVTEPRLSGGEVLPSPLGSGTLRRAVRNGLVAEDLRIPVAPAEGPDLDLVVEDGSNPPLELLAVKAELLPLPWIYFESDSAQPLRANFARPQTPAPRYDLEAMRPEVARLRPAAARWGQVRMVAMSAAADLESPLPTQGVALEEKGYRYSRLIPGGPRGLTALVLDAAVLAHSHDLRDLRIADDTGHQVPYILEKLEEPLSLDLPRLERLPRDPKEHPPGRSRYKIQLPYDRLPPSRLVLATTARVFERPVTLSVERPRADPRSEARLEVVASAVWRNADPERPAPELLLSLPSPSASSAVLALEEGENPALPISTVRLLLPAYRLRFVRTSGDELKLLYGNLAVTSPRYDLALLAPRLVGASAHEVAPGSEAGPAPGPDRTAGQRKVFWATLVAAVLILCVLIARLLAKPAPQA